LRGRKTERKKQGVGKRTFSFHKKLPKTLSLGKAAEQPGFKQLFCQNIICLGKGFWACRMTGGSPPLRLAEEMKTSFKVQAFDR
jgi:hypothetical protein